MIKQIGLPLSNHPILLITCMITDQIGLRSVLLPLFTAWKTSVHHLFTRKMMSDKRAHKFYANDTHYPDLGSASDWLCHVRNLLQPTEALPRSCSSMDFLHLFFRWRNQKMSAVFSGYTIYSSLYVVWRNCTSQLLNMSTIFSFQVAG